MPTTPSKELETFPNPTPERDYIIDIETPEFTCLCPKTGQPDFATLRLEYVPDRLCVELKSLKLYFWSYRDEGAFHEKVTNTILNDLVTATKPRYMRLTAAFNVRGGIYTTVETEYHKPGWTPPPPPPDYLPRERHMLSGKVAVDEPGKPAPPAATTQVETPAKSGLPPTVRTERFRMLRRTRSSIPEIKTKTTSKPATVAPPPEPEPPSGPQRDEPVFLGIDLGTTGCRVLAIDSQGDILADTTAPLPAPMKSGDQTTQDPTQWWKAVTGCLERLFSQIDASQVHSVAVNGTSGTLLLCDENGGPVTPALMYNDQRAVNQAKKIATVAGGHCGAIGASSSLARLLWLQGKKLDKRATHVLHQADWISGLLAGVFGHSDYNNCLKLGFDTEKMEWPKWMTKLGVNLALLPEVHIPGEVLGSIDAEIAERFGLQPDTQVVAGTTDGVAAFLAAGAREPGHGVTSLGTTLVLKLLSDKPVFSDKHGVYSHRLGNYWLAGGASNSGGVVLQQYFKEDQMREMTPLLEPEEPTGLDYYPLPDTGERFPINDPEMAPRLEPLPGDSLMFFQGMLEGITHIEARGYQLLTELGAPKLVSVWTTGGGSQNPAWERIRERILGIKMQKAHSGHAAYGTALLATGMVAKTFQ